MYLLASDTAFPFSERWPHGYVQAHNREAEAFEALARQFKDTRLLVDIYDTLGSVRKVIELARRLGDRFNVSSIRLDSGDWADLAFQTRRLLDQARLGRLKVFASSGLDEHQIRKLVQVGAPMDEFEVGIALFVSSEAPALGMAYKLV